MASKVLVPTAPFAKLQVKKSPPESGSGFIIGGGDATARVAHLEHSVRFLQEQHRLMLSGLHAEIEALRERNRDLQFQLIFNKESTPKTNSSNDEVGENNEEANLKREVSRLEREAAAARNDANAASARAAQLQRVIDVQTEKLRELELKTKTCVACRECAGVGTGGAGGAGADETRAELRARLADAERLVRRLRGDAERQRREVLAAAAGGAVTNLLFDGAAARHAHLQCMKNSLHASLRAGAALDGGAYGAYQHNYHFPPVHTPEFWREPLRDDYNLIGTRGRSTRRPLTLPELSGQQIRSTVYANNHTRSRANGYEHKSKKVATTSEPTVPKSPEETTGPDSRLNLITNLPNLKDKCNVNRTPTYPELKIVVTKLLPQCGNVCGGGVGGAGEAGRARARRPPHARRPAPDHT